MQKYQSSDSSEYWDKFIDNEIGSSQKSMYQEAKEEKKQNRAAIEKCLRNDKSNQLVKQNKRQEKKHNKIQIQQIAVTNQQDTKQLADNQKKSIYDYEEKYLPAIFDKAQINTAIFGDQYFFDEQTKIINKHFAQQQNQELFCLDVGAGVCRQFQTYCKIFKKVDFMDKEQSSLKKLKTQHGKSQHFGQIYHINANSFYPEKQYNMITFNWVLQRLDDSDAFDLISRLAKNNLKKDGCLMISDSYFPNLNQYKVRVFEQMLVQKFETNFTKNLLKQSLEFFKPDSSGYKRSIDQWKDIFKKNSSLLCINEFEEKETEKAEGNVIFIVKKKQFKKQFLDYEIPQVEISDDRVILYTKVRSWDRGNNQYNQIQLIRKGVQDAIVGVIINTTKTDSFPETYYCSEILSLLQSVKVTSQLSLKTFIERINRYQFVVLFAKNIQHSYVLVEDQSVEDKNIYVKANYFNASNFLLSDEQILAKIKSPDSGNSSNANLVLSDSLEDQTDSIFMCNNYLETEYLEQNKRQKQSNYVSTCPIKYCNKTYNSKQSFSKHFQECGGKIFGRSFNSNMFRTIFIWLMGFGSPNTKYDIQNDVVLVNDDWLCKKLAKDEEKDGEKDPQVCPICNKQHTRLSNHMLQHFNGDKDLIIMPSVYLSFPTNWQKVIHKYYIVPLNLDNQKILSCSKVNSQEMALFEELRIIYTSDSFKKLFGLLKKTDCSLVNLYEQITLRQSKLLLKLQSIQDPYMSQQTSYYIPNESWGLQVISNNIQTVTVCASHSEERIIILEKMFEKLAGSNQANNYLESSQEQINSW